MNARSDCGEPIDGASSPSKIPIADVLSRAGHELAHIAWLLENFQTHLSPLIQEAAARDQNALQQMQSFDHIGQITAGLADFLAALALAAPRQWLVDPGPAARTVMLADLSSRLGFADEATDSCSTAWGNCELF
jgi:hypothetical protein